MKDWAEVSVVIIHSEPLTKAFSFFHSFVLFGEWQIEIIDI